jgi:hypothetical protein
MTPKTTTIDKDIDKDRVLNKWMEALAHWGQPQRQWMEAFASWEQRQIGSLLVADARKQWMESLQEPGRKLMEAFGLQAIEQTRLLVEPFFRWLDDKSTVAYHATGLLSDETKETERQESAQWLADKIWKRVYSRNPQVRAGLKSLEATEGKRYIRECLLPGCVLLAIRDASTPQRLRLGREWMTDEQGRIAPCTPLDELTCQEFDQWLLQRARRHLELAAIDEAGGQSLLALADQVRDQGLDLLPAKQSESAVELLSLADLSPQEKRYIEVKVSALIEDPGLSDRRARSRARQNLGLSPAHARQIEFRIRKKLSAVC